MPADPRLGTMTDHGAATTPATASLMSALGELDLPDHIRNGLDARPGDAGGILMGFAANLGEVGHEDQARRVLRTLRDHAPTFEDGQYASVELVRALRESQDAADRDEAERITSALLAPGALEEGPAQVLGEHLQELERWEDALHCYNISARRLLAVPPEELAEEEDDLLLAPIVNRLLARMKSGLSMDAHDEVALAVAQRQVKSLMEFPGAQDPERERTDVEALYSRDAFEQARARKLLTEESAEQGADAYYRASETALRERDREEPGARRGVVLHGVEEIEEFARRFDLDPADGDTVAAWAQEEVTPEDPRFRPWPPARNEACWCGSGRKYKKCCGSPAGR